MDFFDELKKLIDSAQSYLHFQIYIFNDDATGHMVLAWLKEAVKRGVKVYLLVDAYGSKANSEVFHDEIRKSGICFHQFSPLFTSEGFQVNLRLHHKIIMADGNTALIGGINVSNNYSGIERKQAWLDLALLIRGPVCHDLLEICKATWNKTFCKIKTRERMHNPLFFEEGLNAQVAENNWFRRRIEISHNYREALRRSKKEVIIMASYFLPGRIVRRLMKKAALRGVDITIILAAESDAKMMKRATHFLYGFILRNQIKIYEYQPTNLHAKAIVVDGRWSSVGSYNINHLSDYGSIELNLNIKDTRFTRDLRLMMMAVMLKDCRQVTFDEYLHKRNWLSNMADWFSYQLIRASMRIMFFLAKDGKN